MGDVILQQVLEKLRQAGFSIGKAYPGGIAPHITGPVAAVGLEKVDTAAMEATVRVDILAPESQGGTVCEEQARKVLEVLESAGGVCVQHGCEYLALGQMYQVRVEAVFSWAPVEEPEVIWFTVTLAGKNLPWAVEFTVQRVENDQESNETYLWKLQLEEEIPAGDAGNGNFVGGDTLVVESAGERISFSGCVWSDIRWCYGENGLRRIWTGTATGRSVKTKS